MENSSRTFPRAPEYKDAHKRAITANTEIFNLETRKGKPTRGGGERFHSNSKELQVEISGSVISDVLGFF